MTPDPHVDRPRAPGGPTAAVPAAVAAFIRGIERRGAVLAELQAGDPHAGDAALAAAMRAFRAVGPAEPMARWPVRFWSLLLAAPQLRRPPGAPRDEPGAEWLAGLAPGPRAAILLRLAAGLDEGDAAHALGIGRPAYRQALRLALPRREDGRADPAAWLRLRAHVHRRIKTLPTERLEHLARLREDALAGREPAAGAPAAPGRPAWLRPALAVAAGACFAAFIGTFAWAWWDARNGDLDVARLPTERPAETFDEETRLLTHPHFEMLADPEGMALSAELAFLSWATDQPEIDAAREVAADGEGADAP